MIAAVLPLVATVLLFAFRAVDPDVLAKLLEHRTRELLVRRGVDFTADTVFLPLAVWQWLRSPRPQKPHRRPSDDQARPTRMLLVGLANTVIGFSGPATMYVVGRAIRGTAHHHLWEEAVLYLVFLGGRGWAVPAGRVGVGQVPAHRADRARRGRLGLPPEHPLPWSRCCSQWRAWCP